MFSKLLSGITVIEQFTPTSYSQYIPNTADEDSPLGNTRVSDLVLEGLIDSSKSSKVDTDRTDDLLFKLEFSSWTVLNFREI